MVGSDSMAGWSSHSLDRHCSLLNGLAFRPEDWSEFGLPIIRIQNLNGSREFNRYNRRVPESYIIEPGMLLFSWSGNRGTSFGPYRWDGPTGLLNQHIFKVSPKEGTNPDWLFYALDTVRQRVERSAHGGSGLVHVRRGDLLAYDVLTPPPTEQRRIAAILDTIDEAIRRTEQVIEKLKQVKKGLLHDLLTRGIDENGELRPHPDEAPQLYKDSVVGRIPSGWEVQVLGDISVGGVSNGVFKQPSRVGRGVPLVNVSDLYGEFGVDLSACELFDAVSAECSRFGVKRGDIFFTRSSLNLIGIAHCNILRDIPDKAVYECHLMRLCPESSVAVSEYIALWCRAPFARAFFMARAKQTTMTTIAQPDILPLPVPVPPLPEQKEAVGRFDAPNNRIGVQQTVVDKLRLLKTALMDDLLTGRVRVYGGEQADDFSLE